MIVLVFILSAKGYRLGHRDELHLRPSNGPQRPERMSAIWSNWTSSCFERSPNLSMYFSVEFKIATEKRKLGQLEPRLAPYPDELPG